MRGILFGLVRHLGRPDTSNYDYDAPASSEEASKEDGSALNAINGQFTDHWHTAYSGQGPHPAHPHRLIIDLGKQVEVAGLRYTPRQGVAGVTGRIKRYRIYVGEQLVSEN